LVVIGDQIITNLYIYEGALVSATTGYTDIDTLRARGGVFVRGVNATVTTYENVSLSRGIVGPRYRHDVFLEGTFSTGTGSLTFSYFDYSSTAKTTFVALVVAIWAAQGSISTPYFSASGVYSTNNYPISLVKANSDTDLVIKYCNAGAGVNVTITSATTVSDSVTRVV